MSRGGRGGGRGGKRGPDLSWQDEDPTEAAIPHKNVPGPLFPVRKIAVQHLKQEKALERHLTNPKPLTRDEKASVKSLLHIRERIRNGPLYTVLEPSTLLDDKGKANPRAGFDPFNDQERFTKRYHRKRRIVPDLSDRNGYTLRLFPPELWQTLDPRHRQKEYWDTLPEDLKARLTTGAHRPKRKPTEKLRFVDDQDHHSSSSDEDPTLSASKRRKLNAAKTRKEDPTTKQAKQKKGLDAEDDYGETEPQDENADGAEPGEEEPQDSEYGTEEEDDGGDDYNAEQYFDDGEGDDFAEGDDDPGEREFYS